MESKVSLSQNIRGKRLPMTKKEMAEIKRRFTQEHNNITCIKGCYVNSQGQVITTFTRSLPGMGQEEAEKYLSIFRRTLSGEQEQNLWAIDFSPEQVLSSSQHQHLMALCDCALKDENTVQTFFDAVRAAYTPGENEHYLILLMHDGYDVPYRSQDDQRVSELSTEVFHYILCSVCPVKMTKPALAYDPDENAFRNKEADWVVGMPEIGFMFPAFDERAANIYGAVYYTKDTGLAHEEFTEAVFGTLPPTPAKVQTESFRTVLQSSLGDECSLEIMQNVHEQVMEKIVEQKADKTARELPRMDSREVTAILQDCGVTEEKRAAFEEAFDREFGTAAELNAAAVSSPRQFQLRTPNVIIRVSPDRSDLVETRMIDGHPYILIRAEEGVEVNGVNVNIR